MQSCEYLNLEIVLSWFVFSTTLEYQKTGGGVVIIRG